MSTGNAADPQSFAQELSGSVTGVGLVWAQTSGGVIGKNGDMPWHLPEDLKHFNRLTMGHPVIMGRKTWLSFPDKYRPLPGRTNIVITRQKNWGETPEAEGAVVVPSLDDALLESQFVDGGGTVWILGGGEVFRQSTELANVAVVTTIDVEADGDTFAPELDETWEAAASVPPDGWLTAANGTRYRFTKWIRTQG
ncbi:dihydrofolate reductase [Pseudarthrobacter sp. AL07]|uniref:dihydrofolate reductase n=1 Tax=unclassified Pseudarthrobacter TaxID=2647000 RepID=UPI002499F6E7|nr:MULTISPECIES: dihydrofolate reductase [unclassified Pseudarthrobacter]MDI3193677.1 dihydrofolate reductase [Pseudarthrobacter sp. AL20]MDI3207813.1 dihydrofolate reductase [Pseudarthrobacter sp. AL07]